MNCAQTSGPSTPPARAGRRTIWLPLITLLLAAVIGGVIINQSVLTVCAWSALTNYLPFMNGLRRDASALAQEELLSRVSPEERAILEAIQWRPAVEQSVEYAQKAHDMRPQDRALLANLVELRIWNAGLKETKLSADEKAALARATMALLDQLESVERDNAYVHLVRCGLLGMQASKCEYDNKEETLRTEYQWGARRQAITGPRLRIINEEVLRQAVAEFHRAAACPRLVSPAAGLNDRAVQALWPATLRELAPASTYCYPAPGAYIAGSYAMSHMSAYALHLALAGDYAGAHALLDDYERLAAAMARAATTDRDVSFAANYLASARAYRAMVYQLQGEASAQKRCATDCEQTLVLADNLTRPRPGTDMQQIANRLGFVHAPMAAMLPSDSLPAASRRLEYAWLDQFAPALAAVLAAVWLLMLLCIRAIQRTTGAPAGPGLLPPARRIALIAVLGTIPWMGYMALCWWPNSPWRQYGLGCAPALQLGGYGVALGLCCLVAGHLSRRSLQSIAPEDRPRRSLWYFLCLPVRR
jgi:hypothetical protein